jgi:hypothetical protein
MKNLSIFSLIVVALCSTNELVAQGLSYDILAKAFSTNQTTGTARFQALGGNHTALGGDISSITGNPAGLGFYTRSEVSLSPGVYIQKTDANYISGSVQDNKNRLTIPNFGLVLSLGDGENADWKTSFGIGFSRQANLNQVFTFQGTNNRSSIADYAAEQANARNISAANLNNDWSQGNNGRPLTVESLFYAAYLIDPQTIRTVNGQEQGFPPYARWRGDQTTAVQQTGGYTQTGWINQWTFGLGAGYRDKIYVGASLGLANVSNFNTKTSLQERYTQSRVVNGLTFNENLDVNGNGYNLSLGAIFRPTKDLRIGLAFTSPTWFDRIEEVYNADVSPDIKPNVIRDDNGFIQSVPQQFQEEQGFSYQLTSPLKASLGVAYFINNKGFISLDAEYVGYNGMQVSSDELSASANANFKQRYNGRINNTYTDVVNLKLGGEFRSGIFAARAGVAYMPSAFRNKVDNINRDVVQLSLGAGIKTNDFYIDIAGVRGSFDSVYTPYTLNNPQDYASAIIKNSYTNVTISVGTYF